MKIYLVASTKMNSGMDRFLADNSLLWNREDSATDPELNVEAAGRICYMSFGVKQHRQSTKDYLANIISQGHDSVLEHSNFTILVDGLTRSLSHQLVRHRVGFAYSQLSQQYYDESDAEFSEPPMIENNSALREKWSAWVLETKEMYKALLKAGEDLNSQTGLNSREHLRFSKSMARSVLPNATKTKLVITGNVRAWRNLFHIRGGTAGDFEMRDYCISVYELLYREAPNLFDGFEISDEVIGKSIKLKSNL